MFFNFNNNFLSIFFKKNREIGQIKNSFKKVMNHLKKTDPADQSSNLKFIEENLKNAKLKAIMQERINSLAHFKSKKEVQN